MRFSIVCHSGINHMRAVCHRLDRELPIFVINLDRAETRLAHMRQQLGGLELNWTRIAAFTAETIPTHWRDLLDDRWLLPGERGCYASHLAILERIVDTNRPALILEDDVGVDRRLLTLLDEIDRHLPPNWDFVRLSNRTKHPVHAVSRLSGGLRLVRYARIPRGTGASLVSPSGAAKFLRRTRRYHAIDQDLRMAWRWGLSTFGIAPAIVDGDVCGGSSIRMSAADTAQMNRRNRFRRFFENEFLARHSFGIREVGFTPWVRMIREDVVRQATRLAAPFSPRHLWERRSV